jgi:predicted glycoside hydrolase/deacetylase ChbG (UPF0249 family)
MTIRSLWDSAALAVLALPILFCGSARAQAPNIAERFGYPKDAKLLIIHADDLAVAHSEDAASFYALDHHDVTSASVLVACPWLTEVADYAKAHPDADIGIHLDITSEWKTYRWGPVAPHDQVPSLLAPDGYFYSDTAPAAAHSKPAEVEIEIRAQIERAISVGIHPTHLDIHMGALAATPELYAVLVKVAHEYHLPFMAVRMTDARQKWLSMLSPKDVVLDSLVMFNPGVTPNEWTATYVKALGALGPGLHELIVHLGYDDAELQAITQGHPDYGAAWRQRDFNAVTSAEFQQAIKRNHIILVHYRDLDKLVR